GKDHLNVAHGLGNLALLYGAQGEYARAEPLFQRSLKTCEAKLGKDHPDVARSLNNLAALYWHQGQHAKAEPLFLRGLQIYESKFGKDHPAAATCLLNLAALYVAMQRWQDAARCTDRAWRGQHQHMTRVLPGLAPQEQLAYLHEKVSTEMFAT